MYPGTESVANLIVSCERLAEIVEPPYVMLKLQVAPPQAAPAEETCLHCGELQSRDLNVVDMELAKTVEEQPWQPVQGIQAASLLVSMAMSIVCGGVPIWVRTMYVGDCVICLPEAIGTTDFLAAAREERYWSLAWSLDCVWRTFCSHESGLEDLKGEHGLLMWSTWRVESWSWFEHFGFWFSPWVREKQRMAREMRWVFIVFS